jgi:hypothetical protein
VRWSFRGKDAGSADSSSLSCASSATLASKSTRKVRPPLTAYLTGGRAWHFRLNHAALDEAWKRSGNRPRAVGAINDLGLQPVVLDIFPEKIDEEELGVGLLDGRASTPQSPGHGSHLRTCEFRARPGSCLTARGYVDPPHLSSDTETLPEQAGRARRSTALPRVGTPGLSSMS